MRCFGFFLLSGFMFFFLNEMAHLARLGQPAPGAVCEVPLVGQRHHAFIA